MVAPHPARHLQRARDLVDSRYADPLTVADLAAAAMMSRAHFSREFARAYGEPPHAYLQTRRLERAAAMLRSTDYPVIEICIAVGLRSIGSFTTSFGRVYGCTPTQYRESAPPAATWARIPSCVLRVHARPAPDTRVGSAQGEKRAPPPGS